MLSRGVIKGSNSPAKKISPFISVVLCFCSVCGLKEMTFLEKKRFVLHWPIRKRSIETFVCFELLPERWQSTPLQIFFFLFS